MLWQFGLSGAVLQWFSSYLSGRMFQVVDGVSASSVVYITCSIPQGAVLGPVCSDCTVSHKKRSQLIFVCNFVRNKRILMYPGSFHLFDLTMNDTRDSENFTHLT